MQSLARKIGELDAEADEHTLVLNTLEEALAEDPDRKCFRLVGGVLVERTVKDVSPALQTNRDGVGHIYLSADLTLIWQNRSEKLYRTWLNSTRLRKRNSRRSNKTMASGMFNDRSTTGTIIYSSNAHFLRLSHANAPRPCSSQ